MCMFSSILDCRNNPNVSSRVGTTLTFRHIFKIVIVIQEVTKPDKRTLKVNLDTVGLHPMTRWYLQQSVEKAALISSAGVYPNE